MARAKRCRTGLVAIVVAMATVGCGGNGEDADPGATATPTAAAESSPSPAAPAMTATQPPTEAGTEAPPDGESYVVESGDTLTSIAERFNTTVDAIVEANNLDDPDVIGVGDELVIPTGE